MHMADVLQTVTDFISIKLPRSKNLSGALSKKAGRGAINDDPAQLGVRLLDPPSRLPRTPLEKLAGTILKKQGPTPFPALVEHVARETYFYEIRNGASAVDIGLFGPDLFVSEVISGLKAGNGILWKIEKPE